MKELAIIILFMTTNCNKKLNDHYKGYVYTLKKEPLHNVKVYESVDSTKYVYTDKNGYFLLPPRSLNFTDDLIFEKENYVTDTVDTYYTHRTGTITYFLTQRSDTLFMEKAKQKTLPNIIYSK